VDLMAAQGAFGTDFYDRSTRTIVGTMLWTGYRPVIKIGSKGALDSHEISPIHSAPSLGQSIVTYTPDFVVPAATAFSWVVKHHFLSVFLVIDSRGYSKIYDAPRTVGCPGKRQKRQ